MGFCCFWFLHKLDYFCALILLFVDYDLSFLFLIAKVYDFVDVLLFSSGDLFLLLAKTILFEF